MRERERVFLWNVQSYDPAIIADRVGKAMDKLLIKPKGRVLVKPNCVLAHPQLSPHAFTRPEVLDGVLQALQARATEDTAGIVVGERCGITVPTRFPFRSAGYLPVCKRHGVEPRYFEEERPVEVLLEHKEDPFGGMNMYPMVRFSPYWNDGQPFGLVDNLKSPQEEENNRRSQALHILNQTSNSGWIVN